MIIAGQTAAGLTRLYRRGELSHVAKDIMARIDANRSFNAFMAIDEEGVLASARASEERWGRGEPAGLIDGIPTTVKDNIWLKGFPTRKGSRTTDVISAPDDAPAAARLPQQRKSLAPINGCL